MLDLGVGCCKVLDVIILLSKPLIALILQIEDKTLGNRKWAGSRQHRMSKADLVRLLRDASDAELLLCRSEALM